jgi:histidinol phosphatase-like PHP family hydrolase
MIQFDSLKHIEEFKVAAEALAEAAKQQGVIITIETRPLSPLAMRNFEMICEARAAR